jgi:hypothetical protein
MALAFDKGDAFAIDKPAGLPCPNLKAHKCTIYDNLDWHGFAGCAAYDCGGAGQHVTQEVFAGRSWRDEPELAMPMIEAFRQMRLVHDLLDLLVAAKGLDLPDAVESERAELMEQLLPEAWTLESLAAFETGVMPAKVRRFLKSLSPFVRPQ